MARHWRKENHPKGDTVLLFERPDADARPNKVFVPVDVRIEFMDATQDGPRWWLRVKINGQEGYVTGEEDFTRLGLRTAG